MVIIGITDGCRFNDISILVLYALSVKEGVESTRRMYSIAQVWREGVHLCGTLQSKIATIHFICTGLTFLGEGADWH